LGIAAGDLVVPGAILYVVDTTDHLAPKGEHAFITAQAIPSSGTLAIAPVLTVALGAADTIEVWHRDLGHITRVNECIDTVLGRELHRPVLFPLTLLIDGDMQKTAAWAGSSATPTKELAAETEWAEQVTKVIVTVAGGYAYPADVAVVPAESFSLVALARGLFTSGSHQARVWAYDVSNSAAITLSGDGELAQIGGAWQVLRNRLTVPSGCSKIEVRIGAVAGETDTVYFAWVALLRWNDRSIVLPDRITDLARVGRIYAATRLQSSPYETPASWALSEITAVKRTKVRETIRLDFPSTFGSYGTGLFFWQELQPYAALATDSATTEAPLDWLTEAVALELYKLAYRNWRAGHAQRAPQGQQVTTDPNPWGYWVREQTDVVAQLKRNALGPPAARRINNPMP
jgi:hypothetical protein